jgi:hypothetical protein
VELKLHPYRIEKMKTNCRDRTVFCPYGYPEHGRGRAPPLLFLIVKFPLSILLAF